MNFYLFSSNTRQKDKMNKRKKKKAAQMMNRISEKNIAENTERQKRLTGVSLC